MPRAKAAKREQQIYRIPAYGAVVTIDYDANNPPPFYQPGPGIVIVGEHVCGESPNAPRQALVEPGPSFDDIKEFQKRREAQPQRKPFTTEDAAREAGLPPQALSFEALSGIAAQMPQAEESLVE
jgi:hypothetical protein